MVLSERPLYHRRPAPPLAWPERALPARHRRARQLRQVGLDLRRVVTQHDHALGVWHFMQVLQLLQQEGKGMHMMMGDLPYERLLIALALATTTAAGKAVGDPLWRFPIGPAYDKLIDSPIADMKNVGPREGGSITAAQFLNRFVEEGVKWAHLDIAGTAMGSPSSDINQSWSSGWGVRLLDRLVRDHYEAE